MEIGSLSLGCFQISFSPQDDGSQIVSVSQQVPHHVVLELSNYTGKLCISKVQTDVHERIEDQENEVEQHVDHPVDDEQRQPTSSCHGLETFVRSDASTPLSLCSSENSDEINSDLGYVGTGTSSESADRISTSLHIDTSAIPIQERVHHTTDFEIESQIDTNVDKTQWIGSDGPSPASTVDETPQNKRSNGVQFSFGLVQVGSGSTLHDACIQRSTNLQQLRSVLAADPGAASKPDSMGKLPLHVLSENEALLQRRQGREDAHEFALDLIELHPDGIITQDKAGRVPFTALILNWVEQVQQSRSQHSSVATSFLTRSMQSNPEPGVDRDLRGSELLNSISLKYFTDVDISPSVEWCFIQLSLILGNMSGKGPRPKKRSRGWQRRAGAALAENVASIPLFLQTIFLIEDDRVRSRLIELSIFRRVLMCPSSVGPWIEKMLQQGGIVSKRAVDYFVELSDVTVKDFVGSFRTPRAEDLNAFHKERNSVIEVIEGMHGILPSLLVLDNREIERAATTDVVWTVLNAGISRPFVIGIVVIDFILHIAIILAFRSDAIIYPTSEVADGDFVTIGDSNISLFLVQSICIHFCIRKIGGGLSLLVVSSSVFRSFFLNFWNLLDVVTIALAMAANILLNRGLHYPEFNAIVVGLLWLKLLGFLKAVNLQLATFILAVVEILLDIRWFMLIVLIAILMFGDMMHIIMTQTDNGAVCQGDLDLAAEDFCTNHYFDSYLRMYTVLLGDFNLHTFRDLAAITALFVVFTLLGFLVLLNVLIAVVSDSYEKSRLSSKNLFGRARVGFVVEHISLERFLHSNSMPPRGVTSNGTSGMVLGFLCRIGKLFTLLSLIGTALLADTAAIGAIITFAGDGNVFKVAFSCLLVVILTTALGAVISVVLSDCVAKWRRAKGCADFLTGCIRCPIHVVATRVFGVQQSGVFLSDDETDEWHGRLEYFNTTIKKLVSETEHNLHVAVRSSEMRIKDHENSLARELKSEINKVEDFN